MNTKDTLMLISELPPAQRAILFAEILKVLKLKDGAKDSYGRALTASAFHWTHSDPTTVAFAHLGADLILSQLYEAGADTAGNRYALEMHDVLAFLGADYDLESCIMAVEMLGCERRADSNVWSTEGGVKVTRLNS